MFFYRRAVESLVSLLLASLILISASVVVYLWGVPYIEKNKALSEVAYLQEKFVEIPDRIGRSLYSGRACVKLDTDASIVISDGSIQARYFSPTSLYNNLIRVPLNYELFLPESFTLSPGEYKIYENLNFSFDGSSVRIYDNLTKIEKIMNGNGTVITSTYIVRVGISGEAKIDVVDKVIQNSPVCISYILASSSGEGQYIYFNVNCNYFTDLRNLYRVHIIPGANAGYAKGTSLCFYMKSISYEEVNTTLPTDRAVVYNVIAQFE